MKTLGYNVSINTRKKKIFGNYLFLTKLENQKILKKMIYLRDSRMNMFIFETKLNILCGVGD